MRQALETALEALEKIATVNAMDYEYQQWAKEYLAAIKEALAQRDSIQAKPEPEQKITHQQAAQLINEMSAQPKEPEQEPVANYCRECLTYNGHQEGCSQYVATQNEKQKPAAWRLYKDGELYALKYEKEDRGLYYTWDPLYTTPPQRKPLTRAQIINALATTMNFNSRDYDEIIEPITRAIEAAHGIKGD